MGVAALAAVFGCSSSHDVAAHTEDQIVTAGAAAPTASAPAPAGTRTATGQAQTQAQAPVSAAMGRNAAAPAAAPSGNVERKISGSMLDDIHYAFDVTVPAGGEEFRCIYAQLPEDRGVVNVDHVESHYTPGSHHLLAYRSNLTSIPEEAPGVWDCGDGLWQINMRGSYYEAQRPDEEHKLPKGIAHKFQPGEVLIIQAHYINPTDKELAAHVEMTLHPTDPKGIEQEAGTIFFNNINILVPAHGTAKSNMRCELPTDIQLALLWSHMHERGVHFVVETDDEAAAKALGTLYEEDDWAEPDQRAYPNDSSAVLHAGSHINFSCTFENPGDATYVFGNSAHDNEMCILHGMYWPRMSPAYEQCLLGNSTRD
jgi:hypothetical protein